MQTDSVLSLDASSSSLDAFLVFLSPEKQNLRAARLARALVDAVERLPFESLTLLSSVEPSVLEDFMRVSRASGSPLCAKWAAALPCGAFFGQSAPKPASEYHFVVSCSFGPGVLDEAWRILVSLKISDKERVLFDENAVDASFEREVRRI